MSYIVKMQEEDYFDFWHVFSDEDAAAIRAASVDIQFKLSNGYGTLFKEGMAVLTFRSGTGQRLHVLNYKELIRQFDQRDLDDSTDE
jgi:hypothetical protein